MSDLIERGEEPLCGQLIRPLFGSTSVFGDRQAFCARIVGIVNERAQKIDAAPPFDGTDDPVHALGTLQRSELCHLALDYGISIDELAPLPADDKLVAEFIADANQRGVSIM